MGFTVTYYLDGVQVKEPIKIIMNKLIKLEDLIEKVISDERLLQNIDSVMQKHVHNNFNKETDPDGYPWQKLSERRIREKTEKGTIGLGILQDTQTLIRSFRTERAGKKTITFGTSVPYAAMHNDGDPDTRTPARRFLGWTEESLIEVVDGIQQSINMVVTDFGKL